MHIVGPSHRRICIQHFSLYASSSNFLFTINRVKRSTLIHMYIVRTHRARKKYKRGGGCDGEMSICHPFHTARKNAQRSLQYLLERINVYFSF